MLFGRDAAKASSARRMPHNILIVDDDADLRQATVEQIAPQEEFESVAVENGTKGVQTDSASHYPNNGKIIRSFNGFCFAATSNRWLAAIA